MRPRRRSIRSSMEACAAIVLALLAPAPANATPSAPGDLTLVSTSSLGVKGNGDSEFGIASADGTKVVFWSTATNLVPNDTDTIADVYVKDLVTGTITLASTSDSGVKGNGDSMARGAISADGTRVAFFSDANNLDPLDTDFIPDVYVKDLGTGDLTLVSIDQQGDKANARSFGPVMSADGSRVGFYTWATNLDPRDTDAGVSDVYVKDLDTGVLKLVSTDAAGVKGNGASYSRGAMSADGSQLAFWSRATNLAPNDTDTIADVYVKNVDTGAVVLASQTKDGVKGNGASYGQKLSADGSLIAFHSDATNLDPNDPDDEDDIYVKNLVTGELTLASTSTEGVKGNGESEEPVLSEDGVLVTFYSEADNLDPADTDELDDVYVKNLVTGVLTLVSTSNDGTKGNGDSSFPRFALGGTQVAFMSTASNLDPGDPDHLSDVFVKELAAAPLVSASGNAYTDYDGNGHGGQGDVHIAPDVSTGLGPAIGTGTVRYDDLRADPPGPPTRSFTCTGHPVSLRLTGPAELVVGGTVVCRRLARAATFSLIVSDQGPNPPNADAYHMTLLDRDGLVLYDWSDSTTVGLGDLTVSVG
jgi:hypothetical protein